LRLEPCFDVLIFEVFEPTIRILVGSAEINVTGVDGSRFWIVPFGKAGTGYENGEREKKRFFIERIRS
jgi:hypothetical protein